MQGLRWLERVPTLTSLDLSHCYKVSDAGLTALHPLYALRELSLSWCCRITDLGVKALASLPPTLTGMRVFQSGCLRSTLGVWSHFELFPG